MRRFLVPIALVVTGFTGCFLVLELVLRMSGYDPMGGTARGRQIILRASAHPELDYELNPNAQGRAWRTDVQVNSHGMRDREVTLERGEAVRIVAVGDSVTFGNAVAVGERFTEVLETRLEQRLSHPVEVLNLGVGGYDALQAVITLEHIGLRFSPDLVIVAFCVNDVGDNSPNLEYLRRLWQPQGPLLWLRTAQLLRTGLDRLRLMRSFEADNSDERFADRNGAYILPVADDARLGELRAELETHAAARRELVLSWYLSDAHLGKLEYALTRLARVSREHGFPVLVAIVPYLEESPAWPVVYAMVEHMAVKHGFAAVQLGPALAGRSLASLRARRRDPFHPSADGHRLIGEALAEDLARRRSGPQALLP